ASCLEPDRRCGLRPRCHVDGLLAVQRLDRQPGTERRRGHRHSDPAMQVVSLAREHVVRALMDLHVQIAGRAAARSDLALAGEPDPHLALDPGRNLHGELATRPDPPVTRPRRARVPDYGAEPSAGRTRTSRHHLAKERALDALHLAATVAGVAGLRMRTGRRA